MWGAPVILGLLVAGSIVGSLCYFGIGQRATIEGQRAKSELSRSKIQAKIAERVCAILDPKAVRLGNCKETP
jgi:hypothetical protein